MTNGLDDYLELALFYENGADPVPDVSKLPAPAKEDD